MGKSKSELTEKEQLFVLEYLKDFNATKAAERAKYSKKTAGAIGHENLRKPKIQTRIREQVENRAKRLEVSVDWVLEQLVKIAKTDIRKAMSWNESGVNIIPSEDLDEDTAYGVSEVKETVNTLGHSVKLKLHNKTDALELIGKHLSMFKDTVDANHTGEVTVRIYDYGKKPKD